MATVTQLLLLLDYAKNALEEHHNFNLAEVHTEEFLKKSGKYSNARGRKSLLNALDSRDSELLLAAVDAEIERLSVVKINEIRKKITSA